MKKKILFIFIIIILGIWAVIYFAPSKTVMPAKKYQTEIRQIKRNAYIKEWADLGDDTYMKINLIYLNIKGKSPVAKTINADINKDIYLSDINPSYLIAFSNDFSPEEIAERKEQKKQIENGLYKAEYKIITKSELNQQLDENGVLIPDDDEFDKNDLLRPYIRSVDTEVSLLTDSIFSYTICIYGSGGGTLNSHNRYNYLYAIENNKATRLDYNSVFGSNKNRIINELVYRINEEKKKIKEDYIKEFGEPDKFNRVNYLTVPIAKKDFDENYIECFSVSEKGITFELTNHYDIYISSQYETRKYFFRWDEIIDYIDNDTIEEYGKKHCKTK